MPKLDYRRVGQRMADLASDDDRAVGRALTDLDWLLAQGGSSWAALGREVAKLGDAQRSMDAFEGRTARPNGERQPSQWRRDCEALKTLMKLRDRVKWDAFRDELLPSFYQQCVEEQRTLSEKQRDLLYDQLDKAEDAR